MIEDIEYLKANCDKDSTVVYIDSSDRDRRFFPTPAEYTISFNQPYKFITGFDVLDASIPTTMWNVDKYNGTLAITVVNVPVAEQNKQLAENYWNELRDVFSFSSLFERNHILNILNENFVVVVSDEFYTQQNISSSVAVTPYFVYVRRVFRNTNIRVAPKNIDAPSVFTFEYREKNYFTDLTEVDVIAAVLSGDYHIKTNDDGLYDIYYFEQLNVSEAVYTSVVNTQSFVINIQNYYKQIALGNYDITTLKTELNSVWNLVDVYFEATTLPDRKQGILFLRSSGFLLINGGIGRLIRQLGFDTLPTSLESTIYSTSWVGKNTKIFAGNFQDDSSKSYIIQAPGIVNLLGNRYLILRCKEIEDHLLGSFGYMKHTPGIGLFKLASSYNDVTHLRFDFVNLVRKPFHPIGKLAKLSIRFETQEGDLYDFKGVNHQLLFMIKFLAPTQKVNFNKYILNPNYDANYMRYMSQNKTIEYKEDSDKEEEFNDEENKEQYKKDLQTYDYSTSGSEYESDDSEIEFDFSGRTRGA